MLSTRYSCARCLKTMLFKPAHNHQKEGKNVRNLACCRASNSNPDVGLSADPLSLDKVVRRVVTICRIPVSLLLRAQNSPVCTPRQAQRQASRLLFRASKLNNRYSIRNIQHSIINTQSKTNNQYSILNTQ